MAKQSGIGERLFVNQWDLSGDVGALTSVLAGRNLFDDTGLNKAAVERLRLLKDGQIAFTGFFNAAAGGEHSVLKALPGLQSHVTWATGVVLGDPTGSLIGRQGTFDYTRGADGSLVMASDFMGDATGMQWGNLLTTGQQTFASAAAGTGIDDYVPRFGSLPLPSANGLAAFLHVFSVGSGSFVATIQHSTDNLSFANVTGGAFASASAAGSQRIQTSLTATINRYLRVNVSGTFTNASIAVAVVRYISPFNE